MKLNKEKNIGLVGAGFWGKNLVRVFNKLGVLKIICDIDKKVLAERKREYPDIKTTTNFLELLRDKEIQGIGIATPAATHYDLTKKTVLAGKDVFVEKPLALKVKEGEELAKLVKKERRVLIVGHLLLYHPAIIKLKKIIKRGDLGDIHYFCSSRLNFGKLRREENVLWSFAPHDISVILDIYGQLPKRVRTVGKTYLSKNIPDITLSFLEFKNNKAAHIFVSWLNPFKEQTISVIGTKAMAVFNGIKNELKIYFHKIEGHKALKVEGKKIEIDSKEPLMEEAKHFLRCIKNREKPITDGEEALKVLKILEACQKSLNKNGEIINL